MGNLGFSEIMIILLVVLLVFGAKRLPEMGASIGKGHSRVQEEPHRTQDEVMRQDTHQTPAAAPDGREPAARRSRPASRSGCHSRSSGCGNDEGATVRSPLLSLLDWRAAYEAACWACWLRW